jgi:hypothetical protein
MPLKEKVTRWEEKKRVPAKTVVQGSLVRQYLKEQSHSFIAEFMLGTGTYDERSDVYFFWRFEESSAHCSQ